MSLVNQGTAGKGSDFDPTRVWLEKEWEKIAAREDEYDVRVAYWPYWMHELTVHVEPAASPSIEKLVYKNPKRPLGVARRERARRRRG